MGKSSLEASFEISLRSGRLRNLCPEIAGFVREHRFDARPKPRRWKLDFAWLDFFVAVECDGLLWSGPGGGHQRPQGYRDDCEKLNEATRQGWQIYRYTRPDILDGTAATEIARKIKEITVWRQEKT